MEVGSDPGFLFEGEMDDDVFYAEIRRRILQLTTEDEEDNDLRFLGETKRVNNNSNNLIVSGGGGPLYRSAYGFGSGLPGGSHFWSWEAQNSGVGPPPVWLMNLWNKNGKGTGVFIPQAVRCKKNTRAGRMNSKRKAYKPVATKD